MFPIGIQPGCNIRRCRGIPAPEQMNYPSQNGNNTVIKVFGVPFGIRVLPAVLSF